MRKVLTLATVLLALAASTGCNLKHTPAKEPGDRYENAKETTLEDIERFSEGEMICVKDVHVVASSSKYRLIWDGEDFGVTDAEIAVGRKATIKGRRGDVSVYTGHAIIFDSEVYDETDSDCPTPLPSDITEGIDEFSYWTPQYVSLSGIAGPDGDIVTVTVDETPVHILHPTREMGFSVLNAHKVKITGYTFYTVTYGLYIVVTAVEDIGEGDAVAEWKFSEESRDTDGPTFTGTTTPSEKNVYTSANVKNAGDDGKYVKATTSDARITYVSVDKTTIDTKNWFLRKIGSSGKPTVTGVYKGDYWLFTAPLKKEYPAGSEVSFTMKARATDGSMRYWALEILENGVWVPMRKTQTSEADGETFTYNCIQLGGKVVEFAADHRLTSTLKTPLQIRYRAAANVTCNGNVKNTPDGGTHRLDGVEIDIYSTK